jgi:hypothetical protein
LHEWEQSIEKWFLQINSASTSETPGPMEKQLQKSITNEAMEKRTDKVANQKQPEVAQPTEFMHKATVAKDQHRAEELERTSTQLKTIKDAATLYKETIVKIQDDLAVDLNEETVALQKTNWERINGLHLQVLDLLKGLAQGQDETHLSDVQERATLVESYIVDLLNK